MGDHIDESKEILKLILKTLSHLLSDVILCCHDNMVIM